MSKHEYIRTHKTVGVYSGWGGIEIKGIEYDRFGYPSVYAVSGAFAENPMYHSHHRVKMEYTLYGEPYFRIFNHRIPLRDCIRT